MGLGIHRWTLAEHLVCSIEEFLLLGGDLRGVELIPLGQLTHRFALLERIQHHPGLKRGSVLSVVLLRGHDLAKFQSSPVLISPTTSPRSTYVTGL